MNRTELARRLRAIRIAKGLTQQELADETEGDVSRGRIQDLEQGVRSAPTVRVVRALCRSLGVSYEDLTGLPDPEDAKADYIQSLTLKYRLKPGTKLTPELELRARRIAATMLRELGIEIKDEARPRRRRKD